MVSTFGLRGDLKLNLQTDFPERFAQTKEVCLRPMSGEPRLFVVQRAREHKTQILLKLAGIDTIEAAEAWRGSQVQVRRQEAVPLPSGSFYASDILGMDVVTVAGRLLGKLDEVLPYPGHDLFRVGQALIPAVKEIVVEVDVSGKRIVVDPPTGLLD